MTSGTAQLAWDQTMLESNTPFNNGLLSLLAFDTRGYPRLIGTAFIISAQKDYAIAATAAHNFEGITQIQNEAKYNRHPSALNEFLPKGEEISLDRNKIRAIYNLGNHVEVCIINWAMWDRVTDICFFQVVAQDKQAVPQLFQWELRVDDNFPSIGEEVALLGYADMDVQNYHRIGVREEFSVGSRLLLRRGYVTQVFPEGHILCRGPCIETSIPVFPGMSGGPVMRLGDDSIKPFGVISSDPEDPPEQKNNRNIPGHSVVALLNASVQPGQSGTRHIEFTLAKATVATNPESLEVGSVNKRSYS